MSIKHNKAQNKQFNKSLDRVVNYLWSDEYKSWLEDKIANSAHLVNAHIFLDLVILKQGVKS